MTRKQRIMILNNYLSSKPEVGKLLILLVNVFKVLTHEMDELANAFDFIIIIIIIL